MKTITFHLDGCTYFNKNFAKITGSVVSAVLLSELLSRIKNHQTNSTLSPENTECLMSLTGLNKQEFSQAIDELSELNIVTFELDKSYLSVQYVINLDVLEQLIERLPS
jgi:hypothetical protein